MQQAPPLASKPFAMQSLRGSPEPQRRCTQSVTHVGIRVFYRMTPATNIMAELIRAANEISSFTAGERRNLMVRASRAVRELRLKTGVRPGRGKDALFGLEIAAMRSENNPDDTKAILLKLADMIRTLKIMVDTNAER